MTTPAASILAFANVQMAAEAVFGLNDRPPGTTFSGRLDDATGQSILTDGNSRSSKFTSVQAIEFGQIWEVVEHTSNTATGFSGSLFKVRDQAPADLLAKYGLTVGQLVISFRSTEFIDDAARDNQATNTLELKEFGWAFGQIADMEKWYADLAADPSKLGGGARFSVTGYSLGGHLATAFNLLRRDDGTSSRVEATYTFNGAGVGTTVDTRLDVAIQTFRDLYGRTDGLGVLFEHAEVKDFYAEMRSKFSGTGTYPSLFDIARAKVVASTSSDAELIVAAMERMRSIGQEAERINGGIASGGGGGTAAQVGLSQIAALSLDYQLAVLKAAIHTQAVSTDAVSGGWAAIAPRNPVAGLSNVYDVFGANPPSAVANSQLHYGTPVPVYVEDQPLMRGNILASAPINSALNAEIKLLVSGFSVNDFGDTHSLVLLVDSLSVQAAMSQLDSTLDTKSLSKLLAAGGNLFGQAVLFEQGRAEGDTLELIVNGLAMQLGVPSALKGDPSGGTWARIEDTPEYSGRSSLHEALKRVTDSTSFKALAGKATLSLAGINLQAQAKTDFGAFLALQALSPVVLRTNDPQALVALKSVHPDLAPAWDADRNARLYGDTAREYDFTDQWYADRAGMLAKLVERNQRNLDPLSTPTSAFNGRNILFLDNEQEVRVASGVVASAAGGYDIYAFGKESDDVAGELSGGVGNDHLYGMGGDDVLIGYGGNDYMEGGVGADTLTGGAGADTLLGGRGYDIYSMDSGWGQDTITDSDALGEIRLNGQTLSGTFKGIGERGAWGLKLADGTAVGLSVYEDAQSSTGKSAVLKLSSSEADSITIRNFDLTKAQGSGGFLGLRIDPVNRLIVAPTGGEALAGNPSEGNPFQASEFDPNTFSASAQIAEGAGQGLVVWFSQAAKAGQSLVLNLAGTAGEGLKALIDGQAVAAPRIG